MATAQREMLIIGDANARRYFCHLDHQAHQTDFIMASNLEEVVPALQSVKPSYKLVVFAFITDLIVSAGEGGAAGDEFERLNLIEDMFVVSLIPMLSAVITANKGPLFYLAAPTFRLRPAWYVTAMTPIIHRLTACLRRLKPNLTSLRVFPCTQADLEPDGVHFNGRTGRDYAQFLLDEPRTIRDAQTSEDRFLFERVATLLADHETRISILEDELNVHRCEAAEEMCGRINSDNQNHFLVFGAPLFQVTADIQNTLKNQVIVYIQALGQTVPTGIVSVRQHKSKTGRGTYDVTMPTAADSLAIRNAYGAFWKIRKGQAPPAPPPILRNVSICISHTFATRVRVRLLKEMARRHRAANPKLSVFVTGYEPRPALKVRQPGGRVERFTYCEALRRFSHHLSPQFLAQTADYAATNVSPESLVPTFLALSPDLLTRQVPQPPADDQVQVRRSGIKRSSDHFVTPTNPKRPTNHGP